MRHTTEFKSVSAFGRFIETAKSAKNAGKSAKNENKDANWDNDLGFQGAVNMAMKGGLWAEGAKEMRAAHVQTSKALASAQCPALEYSVTGHTLDVPEFLAGNPTHWIDANDDDDDGKPIISIGVSVARWHAITFKQIMNRGAAILSIVDSLEEQGNRVELWAVADMGEDSPQCTKILLKASDAPWSPASCAFGLCHSAFSRRLCFRFMEVTPEIVGESRSGYGWGGGNPCDDLFDVYFRGMGIRNAEGWDTPEDAVKTALEQYQGIYSEGEWR